MVATILTYDCFHLKRYSKKCLKCLQMLILILFQIMAIECSYQQTKLIKAAINTHHTIGFHDVEIPPNEPYSPNLIEVKGSAPSFTIKFNSASSKVNLFHHHESSKGLQKPKESYSQDEPHILRQKVMKPIIQEVHEIITPIRKIIQEVKPVVESINTIIARSNNYHKNPKTTSTKVDHFESSKKLASVPVTNTATSIGHHQENIGGSTVGTSILQKQKAIIGDLSSWLAMALKKPDLLIMNENELYDNSLYNGANEYDLKHPSHNSDPTKSSKYELYEDR